MVQAVIRRFEARDANGVMGLILAIQREEFGIAITAGDQPDLAAIPDFYQTGAGDFWVAEAPGGGVVGTIALKDIGGGQAALRKMFVHRDWRGAAGVAQGLLDGLLDAARARGLEEIWLGTTDKFLAAHRFYEKNGFRLAAAESLPAAFPRMAVDSRFYAMAL